MKVQYIIGADLAKKTIDLVCHHTKSYLRIENSLSGYKQMIKWLKEQQVDLMSTWIVMEHTGLYSYCLEGYLHQQQIAFTKVSALAIKRSIGLVRGKSDKIDAARIALFGYEKRDKLVPEAPVSIALQRLQMLHSIRRRAVKQRAGLQCAIKEYRQTGISDKDLVIKSQLQLVKELNKQIKGLEEEMQMIITSDPSLEANYKLLQSIRGIGKEIALTTIIKTKNFSRFINSRKFACFCGTAPFEHTSGSSIKGRTRVSHMADKQMKTLLDQGAKSAIRYDKELKAYYQRRLEMGKSKMSTINIVRNKLIYRMFAVVKRQTPFIEDYLQAA